MPTHHDHPPRLGLRMVGHLPQLLAGFWSSELNRRTVDLLDPRPGEVVLDIGAGMGAGALVAEARVSPGGAVIALDPSRSMRAVLRLRGLRPTVRHLKVRSGAAESLPVAAASVDAAYAVNAAHHFADLALFAAEVARVLRPGGRLLLVEEDMSHPGHPVGFLHHAPAQGSHGHGPHAVDGDVLAGLLAAAGLGSTHATCRTVGGTPATVITASAP